MLGGRRHTLRRVRPFTVEVVARNPKNEDLRTPPITVRVEAASELTWLPSDLLQEAGITPRRGRTFSTPTRHLVTRDVGYAILAAEGYETTDEVVFAESGDLLVLGVRTLDGFGVVVNSFRHGFVAQTTVVATLTTGACPRGPAR